VMFDYGVLKRPQFFYAYDIEKYKEKLRGFYIDYFHELPGPIFTNTDEVIEGLNHFAYYAQQYSDKINSFHNKFCSIENGDRKSTRLNSSHVSISYAVFCLK